MEQRYERADLRAGGAFRLCPRDGSVFTAAGAARAYLAADHAGATPQRLRSLLYDGAIRLCRQGIAALDDDDADLAADRLARARRIIEQLRRGLGAEDPGHRLGRFADLYEQVARRLSEAGFYRSRQPVSETISLLNCWRGDWNALARSLDDAGEPSASAGASWVG